MWAKFGPRAETLRGPCPGALIEQRIVVAIPVGESIDDQHLMTGRTNGVCRLSAPKHDAEEAEKAATAASRCKAPDDGAEHATGGFWTKATGRATFFESLSEVQRLFAFP